MKKIIFIIVCCMCHILVSAQEAPYIIPPVGRGAGNACVIDTSNVQVYYAFCASDIHDRKTYKDFFCLEIGSRTSKFYSYNWVEAEEKARKWLDDHPKSGAAPNVFPKGNYNGWSEYQYSEWFLSGSELTEYCCFPRWLTRYNCYHEERFPDQKWVVRPNMQIINGYSCQQAICRFRGRKFIAWFTRQIPLHYGPWKFGGLPGLILKVTDNDNLYSFECVKIEKRSKPILKCEYKSYNRMDRKKILELQRGIHEDIGKYIPLVNDDGVPVRSFTPYEPLELE